MTNVRTYSGLDDMIELARFAHRNDRDKAGLPYFDHPYRVMQTVQGQGGLPYIQIAAILHDVSEDTAFSIDILKALGVTEPALEIIKLVDRGASKKIFDDAWRFRKIAFNNGRENQVKQYDSMLFKTTNAADLYYAAIARNYGALMVKRADIADNTQKWRLSYLPQATQDRLQEKYTKALNMLRIFEYEHLTS